MIVELIFHISKWEKNNGYKLLDGRVIRDISLSDELIVLENVDISYYIRNRDKEGRLVIDDNEPYEMVQINRILSYGKYWESLHAGMSARLECYCGIEDLTDLLLCKVIQ